MSAFTRIIPRKPVEGDEYFEVLPSGESVGKLPRSCARGKLQQLGHPCSPVRAIRAKCLDCSNGNMAEVRKCTAINCPLWPMRMGVNPYHGKAV